MRTLVVEDEPKMADLIRRGLVEEGHAVDVAGCGEDAIWMSQATAYDVILLDVMLPGIDGIVTCARMRAAGVQSPVLMLTARTAVVDRVNSLDAGADDHLAKPFDIEELLARLRALGRRGPIDHAPILRAGGLALDPATHRAWRGEVAVELSAREFCILELLMRRAGRVVSRFDILEHGWDSGTEHRSNVIDVHVRRLREKIDHPFGTHTIQTIRGEGYRIAADPAGGAS